MCSIGPRPKMEWKCQTNLFNTRQLIIATTIMNRRRSRSPTSLMSKNSFRSTAVNDEFLLDIMRRDRWHRQSKGVRTKALNIQRQKRSLRKIEKQLAEEKARQEGPQS